MVTRLHPPVEPTWERWSGKEGDPEKMVSARNIYQAPFDFTYAWRRNRKYHDPVVSSVQFSSVQSLTRVLLCVNQNNSHLQEKEFSRIVTGSLNWEKHWILFQQRHHVATLENCSFPHPLGSPGISMHCDSWGRKESDTTERLNWTELIESFLWDFL